MLFFLNHSNKINVSRKSFYQSRSFFRVELDKVVDEVEEVPRRDGHDAAASLQRPLVGRVQRLVNVNLSAAKIQL
jgi:hypothetical protein